MMSRFCFCNCPAGFSAAPERHAPDCPGRFGVGKARTPVPATTPAAEVIATQELEAVLHWRGKHAQAIRERDALQLLLNERDEQVHILEQRRHAEQQAGQAAERRVEEMKAALRMARQFVANGVDLGYIRMPAADTPDPAHDLVPIIDATLSK